MVSFIQQNAPGILSALLIVASCVGAYRWQKDAAICHVASGRAPKNAKEAFILPLRHLFHPERKRGWVRRVLFWGDFLIFAALTFMYLNARHFPIGAGICIFLPLTLFSVIVFYYILWLLSILFRVFLQIEDRRLHIFFSLLSSLFLLLLAQFTFCKAADFPMISFALILFDLLFCYLLTAISLGVLFKESFQKKTRLTIRNIWKVTLLILIFFILTLTFLSYAGFLYLPGAYQTADGTFTLLDAFYHIVITFGTVGYGDIVPTCAYTKLVSIATVFTSILCITIMLSTALSLTKEAKSRSDE